jgi:hypothetical protein
VAHLQSTVALWGAHICSLQSHICSLPWQLPVSAYIGKPARQAAKPGRCPSQARYYIGRAARPAVKPGSQARQPGTQAVGRDPGIRSSCPGLASFCGRGRWGSWCRSHTPAMPLPDTFLAGARPAVALDREKRRGSGRPPRALGRRPEEQAQLPNNYPIAWGKKARPAQSPQQLPPTITQREGGRGRAIVQT